MLYSSCFAGPIIEKSQNKSSERFQFPKWANKVPFYLLLTVKIIGVFLIYLFCHIFHISWTTKQLRTINSF